MLTKDREAEIRARAEAAHKGPWHIHEGDLVDANHQDVFDDWEEAYGPNGDEVGPDTAFICNAQVDMIDTLAALDSERQTVAQLERDFMAVTKQAAHLGVELAYFEKAIINAETLIPNDNAVSNAPRSTLEVIIQQISNAVHGIFKCSKCGAHPLLRDIEKMGFRRWLEHHPCGSDDGLEGLGPDRDGGFQGAGHKRKP